MANSGLFVPISGPIVADTFYFGNQLVARDVGITLPEITPVMIDVQAMGTLSLPIWQLIENMEATITRIGVDEGFGSMITPEPQTMEARFAQTVTDANGATKTVGCKAFMRGIPAIIPGFELTIGEALESPINYTITRYQLMVNGTEQFLIDRLATKCRIKGKDYAADVLSLL